jgi:ATP-dependent helicase/nuclease subunit A
MSRSLNNDYAQDVYTPSLVSRPSFMEKDKKLTGAEKGTAVHAVMQKLDFKGELSAESIEAQLKEFVGKNLITEEQKESVDISKILKFFNSDIGKRIIKAEKVYKEVPFHIQLNSTEIFTDLPKEQYKDEKIMLQGIIDCYFEEEGEIILVDYKTDYYKEGQGVLMKERYKVQLDYYARAIEVITNKEVKEKYLYLFYNNEELSIN